MKPSHCLLSLREKRGKNYRKSLKRLTHLKKTNQFLSFCAQLRVTLAVKKYKFIINRLGRGSGQKDHSVSKEEENLLKNFKEKIQEGPKATEQLVEEPESEKPQPSTSKRDLDKRILSELNEFSFKDSFAQQEEQKIGQNEEENIADDHERDIQNIKTLEENVSESVAKKLFQKFGVSGSKQSSTQKKVKTDESGSRNASRDGSNSKNKSPKVTTLTLGKENHERNLFNLFEDWRIMETMQTYVSKHGTEGTMSRSLWETLRDPLYKKKLLDDSRSGESMRERYKRFIAPLTKDAMAEIRRHVRDKNEDEAVLRRSFIEFRLKYYN